MANIRALAKGLLAGRGPAKARRRVGGWLRVDADNVIRGWAWDEADPARRLTVRLLVDAKPIAEVLADRFDPQLADGAHGDGRYGFAVVVPAAFRDEREHSFEGVIDAVGYRLMSKAKAFVIEQGSSLPRLHVVEVSPGELKARLKGGQYANDVQLELWSGGRRIDDARLKTTRLGEGPQAELRLAYPREVFFSLDASAVVAAPGMVEAAAGAAPVFGGSRLRAESRPRGLAVWLDGPLTLQGEAVMARVLAGEEAHVLASAPIELWSYPNLVVLPDGPPADGVRIEVTVDGRSIPGLDAVVGPAGEVEVAAAGNLIRNAELTDWPHGVVVRGGPARFELARGWHARNHKSPASMRAMAAPLDDDGETCSLTLSAPRVHDFCRLEAEVESRLPLAGARLELSFEAAVAHGPTAAFQSPDAFAVIDRIFLAPTGGRSGQGVTVARHVLLSREMKRFALGFTVPDGLAAPGEALVLAFDFKRPAAITLQRPDLRSAAADTGPALLAFEDPGVEAQARLLAGLESWLSPEIVVPALDQPTPARAAPRWDFAPAAQGSVEVVVCMHDAAEETLACLRSLVNGSARPHLVRIVDDASGEDSRRRVEAFIADKPWMRLDPNPGHLGYTASANRGVRASGADWVILLNSDTIVTRGWIEGLLEAAASDPAIGFVGPLSNAASFQSLPEIHDRAGRLKVNDLPPGWTIDRMAGFVAERSERAFPEVPLLNGFCMLMRRDAFTQAGGFNEAAFPMGYGEENDLSLRAAAAGWKLVVADQVYVHHAKSASFGGARRTELQAQGSAALRKLHPGVDFAALGERLRETQPLVRMRALVRAAHRGSAPGGEAA